MDLWLIGEEVNSDFLEGYIVCYMFLCFCDHVYVCVCMLFTAYNLVIDFQLFQIKLTLITFI